VAKPTLGLGAICRTIPSLRPQAVHQRENKISAASILATSATAQVLVQVRQDCSVHKCRSAHLASSERAARQCQHLASTCLLLQSRPCANYSRGARVDHCLPMVHWVALPSSCQHLQRQSDAMMVRLVAGPGCSAFGQARGPWARIDVVNCHKCHQCINACRCAWVGRAASPGAALCVSVGWCQYIPTT
jgi:hypothetical protein